MINVLCLVSGLVPFLREFSWGGGIISTIFALFLFGGFTFGSAIVNLVLATKTTTAAASRWNLAASLGFTAWFWFVQTDMHRNSDAQGGLAYLLITPLSLVVMIPLWIKWASLNARVDAK